MDVRVDALVKDQVVDNDQLLSRLYPGVELVNAYRGFVLRIAKEQHTLFVAHAVLHLEEKNYQHEQWQREYKVPSVLLLLDLLLHVVNQARHASSVSDKNRKVAQIGVHV